MAWLLRFIQIGCWIEIISMHVNAQQAVSLKPFHGPDWQNWDELDLQTRLFSRLDATWIAQGRFSSRLSNPAVGVLGADFNLEVSKYLVITPSYYCFTFRAASGVEGHGQDPILAASVFARYRALTLSDRNRFIGALGITGTQNFWIYGNRPRIDYKIGPDAWKTSLFVWDEIFYFSNHNGWTRNRLAIGGRKALNERTTVNLYYQRQNDGHSSPRVINAVVVLIELRLR
jgi:Protein of unknown function (DUF2490)